MAISIDWTEPGPCGNSCNDWCRMHIFAQIFHWPLWLYGRAVFDSRSQHFIGCASPQGGWLRVSWPCHQRKWNSILIGAHHQQSHRDAGKSSENFIFTFSLRTTESVAELARCTCFHESWTTSSMRWGNLEKSSQSQVSQSNRYRRGSVWLACIRATCINTRANPSREMLSSYWKACMNPYTSINASHHSVSLIWKLSFIFWLKILGQNADYGTLDNCFTLFSFVFFYSCCRINCISMDWTGYTTILAMTWYLPYICLPHPASNTYTIIPCPSPFYLWPHAGAVRKPIQPGSW